ncbi:podocalyxin isoform X2 [Nelusetta ayraudi]|uniref:podocalyxin isoform X2 n=1 Tax=Nelusetta ayraudi TaxID=303726 RepID=UPI003F7303DC
MLSLETTVPGAHHVGDPRSTVNFEKETYISDTDPVIQKTTVTASQGHTTPASSQPAVSTLVPGIPSTTTSPTTPTTIIAGTSAAKAVTTKAEATPAKPATATTPLRFTPTSGVSKAITNNTETIHLKKFVFSLNNGQETEEDKKLVAVCNHLLDGLQDGNCTLTYHHVGNKLRFQEVEISGKVATKQAEEYYEELDKKPTDNKTLIAILASCGALLIMIVILAVCASHHRKPYSENQQHLTEELPTVENGYHDNPTLDVMEAQSEMQEKKSALNGEFIDGWIVPMENMKGDVPDEEDTHL